MRTGGTFPHRAGATLLTALVPIWGITAFKTDPLGIAVQLACAINDHARFARQSTVMGGGAWAGDQGTASASRTRQK